MLKERKSSSLMKMKKNLLRDKYSIGIDEVGRGPIAGPVAVGAFVFLNKNTGRKFSNFRDSKQLTEDAREKWYSRLLIEQKKGNVQFKVTFVGQKIIDAKGLTFAIKEAMRESLTFLALYPARSTVLLDGGLKAPAEYVHQKTIIKGDEKKKVIALASIVAKVERDRLMAKYAQKYAGYGFELHKGYATKLHCQKLKELGMCPLHRRSFLKNFKIRPKTVAFLEG